jgi:hypothetical protein
VSSKSCRSASAGTGWGGDPEEINVQEFAGTFGNPD